MFKNKECVLIYIFCIEIYNPMCKCYKKGQNSESSPIRCKSIFFCKRYNRSYHQCKNQIDERDSSENLKRRYLLLLISLHKNSGHNYSRYQRKEISKHRKQMKMNKFLRKIRGRQMDILTQYISYGFFKKSNFIYFF